LVSLWFLPQQDAMSYLFVVPRPLIRRTQEARLAPRLDPEHERWLSEIVTLEEAAKLRKISIETLRSEIRAGRLKVVKTSKKRRGMTRREALTSIRD
jgi:hypothetical protein